MENKWKWDQIKSWTTEKKDQIEKKTNTYGEQKRSILESNIHKSLNNKIYKTISENVPRDINRDVYRNIHAERIYIEKRFT